MVIQAVLKQKKWRNESQACWDNFEEASSVPRILAELVLLSGYAGED